MPSEQYDLEEQQDIEEQETEDNIFNKEVYKKLKSQKKYQRALEEEDEAKESEKIKHKARFTRKDNENCYICDNCGKIYQADKGTLMYKQCKTDEDAENSTKLKVYGEFAYCDECLKVLYPNYRRVSLLGTIKKTDYRDNHCDTWYNKGFKN